MKNKKILAVISLLSLTALVGCGEAPDEVSPTISSFSLSKDAIILGDSVSFNLVATDDRTETANLVVTYEVKSPSGVTQELTEATFTPQEEGVFEVKALVKDEALNEATSSTLTLEVFDITGWGSVEEAAMIEYFGEAVPFSSIFGSSYEFYLMVNIYETQLGYGVEVPVTSSYEEEMEKYLKILDVCGYVENVESATYASVSYVDEVTDIQVYDKNLGGNDYLSITSYVYGETLCFEFRNATYVKSATWDQSFVDGVMGDISQYIPAFSFSEGNTNGLMVLNDYNHILSSMGALGIQGQLFGVTLDEIGSYISLLEENGYMGGSLDELEEYETTMEMFIIDLETYEMVVVQISSYLEASTPFYTMDIMYM